MDGRKVEGWKEGKEKKSRGRWKNSRGRGMEGRYGDRKKVEG